MVTTSIHRVGNSYRVKFNGQSLHGSVFDDEYFTPDELDELRMAIERAKEQLRELKSESPSEPQRMGEFFAQYQEQLRSMLAATE